MKYDIDRYVGNWIDEEGYRLEIRKKDETNALVSLFSPQGTPVSRPYWKDKKTVDMPAKYDDHMGDFDIQLWEQNKRFCLNLLHEHSPRKVDYGEEILAPSLTRYEDDNHLDQYYAFFGKLSYYKREHNEPENSMKKV